jgi:hypothetical protein
LILFAANEDTAVPTGYPREQIHRIKYTKLTPEQILGKLAAVDGPASASPVSDVIAGKSLTIVLDNGPTLWCAPSGYIKISGIPHRPAASDT